MANLIKTYVVGTLLNRLNEMLYMTNFLIIDQKPMLWVLI